MEVNNILEIKDGDPTRPVLEAPSVLEMQNLTEGSAKKKRRRGKTKRKIMKPFLKIPWQERKKYEKTKRNNRFRKIVVAKSRAPFNNNQFLMEIHKPEPENTFILRTPSARTRDSSFSIDSEDNYFFSLPEDEEEYLTKEFSSVYEDAQSERLSNMSKNELIQEYLLLEAKYDNLVKRTERSKPKYSEDKDGTETDKDTSLTDKDSMLTDKDNSASSVESNTVYEPTVDDVMQRLKEQEEQIRELKLANEKLQHENEHLRQTSHGSTSEDSESDSSSSSGSCSSSSRSTSPVNNLEMEEIVNNHNDIHTNGQNDEAEDVEPTYPLVNGFHSPKDSDI